MSNVTVKWADAVHTASQTASVTAYLGLGANLGDREASILAALRELEATPKIELSHVSSLYETAPVGLIAQPDFLNAACALRTTLEPDELLQAVLHIENKMGRLRTERWGPRVIDIDVLLYGDRQITRPGLTIPHPRLPERAFVLVPLAEIAPNAKIPGIDASIKEICEAMKNIRNNFRQNVVVTRHERVRNGSAVEAISL